jgi:hypothetical protein
MGQSFDLAELALSITRSRWRGSSLLAAYRQSCQIRSVTVNREQALDQRARAVKPV